MADLNLLKFGLELENAGLKAYTPTTNPEVFIDYIIVSDGIGVLFVDHTYGIGLTLSVPVYNFIQKKGDSTFIGKFNQDYKAYRKTRATIETITKILPAFAEGPAYTRLMKGLPFINLRRQCIYPSWNEYYKVAALVHDFAPCSAYALSRGIKGGVREVQLMIDLECGKKNPTEDEMNERLYERTDEEFDEMFNNS